MGVESRVSVHLSTFNAEVQKVKDPTDQRDALLWAESIGHFDRMVRANREEPQVSASEEWRTRRNDEYQYIVQGCMDARLAVDLALDPRKGPVLVRRNSLAGVQSTEMPRHGDKENVLGTVVVGHFSSYAPDAKIGFGECGARAVAHGQLQSGRRVDLQVGRYVDVAQVEPHYIYGPQVEALRASNAMPGKPCAAITVDHEDQRPYLLGIALNGAWDYEPVGAVGTEGIPEIEPDIVQDKYPHIAAMIHNGREYAHAHPKGEKPRKHNPLALWITSLDCPTRAVWGKDLPIGDVMRITYGEDNSALREGEAEHLHDHLSYPFHKASNGEQGHGFENTNMLIIDGENIDVVNEIWKSLKDTKEAKEWIESGPRVVMGVVMNAGNVEQNWLLHM